MAELSYIFILCQRYFIYSLDILKMSVGCGVQIQACSSTESPLSISLNPMMSPGLRMELSYGQATSSECKNKYI